MFLVVGRIISFDLESRYIFIRENNTNSKYGVSVKGLDNRYTKEIIDKLMCLLTYEELRFIINHDYELHTLGIFSNERNDRNENKNR